MNFVFESVTFYAQTTYPIPLFNLLNQTPSAKLKIKASNINLIKFLHLYTWSKVIIYGRKNIDTVNFTRYLRFYLNIYAKKALARSQFKTIF